jgi:hypothetical protein
MLAIFLTSDWETRQALNEGTLMVDGPTWQ